MRVRNFGDSVRTVGAAALGALGVLAAVAPSSSMAFDERIGRKVSFRGVTKLTASDADHFDGFGYSVALDADTLVVGTDSLDEGFGAAYLFERDVERPDIWDEVAKLESDEPGAEDLFGSSVAVSGDTAVVGAPRDADRAPCAGAAYIYQRGVGGVDTWGPIAKLTPAEDAFDEFGFAVAISDDLIAVGAHADDDAADDAGAVYVFQRDAGGPSAWGQVAKLTAADGEAFDNLGQSVGISEATIMAAAPLHSGPDFRSGAAYVFERSDAAAGRWIQTAKLTADDGDANDYFGRAVALSADTAIVGAVQDDDLGPESGSVYIFERDRGGPEAWGQVQKLTAADGEMDDGFGVAVAVDGNTLVIGAAGKDGRSGSVYAFQRSLDGSGSWSQSAWLSPGSFPQHLFGWSVSLSGDTGVAGAYGDSELGIGTGAAYVFQEVGIDPTIALTGACPGDLTQRSRGFTPRGLATGYSASVQGSFAIPEGPCIGTVLSLRNPRLFSQVRVEADGSDSVTRPISEAGCGRYIQLMDLTSCETTNVEQVPLP